MKINICVGSSCHVKGSRQVLEKMQQLIKAHHVEDQVELGGLFCQGYCAKGVCVRIGNQLHSLSPETVENFFENQVLARL